MSEARQFLKFRAPYWLLAFRLIPLLKPAAPPLGQGPPTRGALVGLALATLMASLGTSIANVALPTLVLEFSTSFQAAQWIVLAYLLAITTLAVSLGRLGDLLGRHRLLTLGLALFSAGSLLAGVSNRLWFLVAARLVQGVGAAMMMVFTLALVTEAVPKDQTGRAMGLLGTTSAIGTALGPALGGLLIAGLGWRAIFFVQVPPAAISLLLARRYLPRDNVRSQTTSGSFDALGMLLLVVTLGAYALAVTLGRGHFGALNLCLLLVTICAALLFAKVELKVRFPLIQLGRFRDVTLSTSLAMSALVSTVLMATLVVGPFYLSRALGLAAAQAGLVMSVGPLVAALTGVPAGRLVDRFGAERMTLLGLAGVMTGTSLLALLPTSWGIPGYVAPLVVMTAGYALFQTANNTGAMKAGRHDERGIISGLLNLSRNLGLVTGASVMGAIFLLASRATDITSLEPAAAAAGMRVTFGVAAVLAAFAFGVALRWRQRRNVVHAVSKPVAASAS
jgi:EmrB/QacA subfamily drug resistance transporter